MDETMRLYSDDRSATAPVLLPSMFEDRHSAVHSISESLASLTGISPRDRMTMRHIPPGHKTSRAIEVEGPNPSTSLRFHCDGSREVDCGVCCHHNEERQTRGIYRAPMTDEVLVR